MGMSIDKAIDHLYTYSSTHGSGITTDDQHEEAKKIAISTMRKYKEIREIVKSWKSDTWTDDVSYDCMMKISEVVEDGQ